MEKGLEQRVTALEKEVKELKKRIMELNSIDCCYYDLNDYII